jgi:uncharacterized protein (TIGR02266 family)
MRETPTGVRPAGATRLGETRQWPRLALALHVRVWFRDVGDVAASETVNISRQGLFVRMARPRPVGTRVWLEIQLEGGERFEADGVVAHVEPQRKDHAEVVSGMGVSLRWVSDGWLRLIEGIEAQRRALSDELDEARDERDEGEGA